MAVSVEIRLKTIEEYIKRRHGKTRNTTPREEQVIDVYANRVVQYVKDNWPVDTGTSRDRWLFEYKATAGRLSLLIENPMYYSEYVHRSGGSPENPLWVRLVPEAWSIVKESMLSDLKRQINATERALERRQSEGQRRSPGLLDLIRRPDLVDLIGGMFGG